MAGMTGALLVTVAAVAAFVGFRALNRDELDIEPEPVDYLPVVTQAQRLGATPAYPGRLPHGWVATSVTLGQGDPPSWGLGLLTGDEEFAGIRQGGDTLAGLVETYVDEDAQEGATVRLETEVASSWRTFSDDGGDLAYAAEVGGQPLLVYGSAGQGALEQLLGELTTAPR